MIAGPTAVGKGTVVRHILAQYPEIKVSVSATTRPPRPGEVDGVDYFFVSETDFDAMISAGELLEHATVHGRYRYGTPKGPIVEALSREQLVILEIDLQGARQVKRAMPEALAIFIAPPSWEELVRRLSTRGTETKEQQEQRLETARVELAAQDEFDAVLINDDVAKCAHEVVELMKA